MTLEEALRALGACSRELHDAVEAGDGPGLEAALEKRSQAFERLAGLARATAPTLSADQRALLEDVLRADAATITLATAQAEAIRRELGGLARAREVARRNKDGKDPARFVSERV